MHLPEKDKVIKVSVIIPTFNEAHSIGDTLEAIGRLAGCVEVIIVDCGSNDETVAVARRHGVNLITCQRGRGAQLHAGACAARGEALWFLHADTRPSPDAVERIVEALGDANVVAGNFRVHFDGPGLAARFMTWLYPRLRWLGLCYGDSAIFVRRQSYHSLGGFKPFPIFEDLDLVQRLRKQGRVAHLSDVVVTSSRRFEGHSFAVIFGRWVGLQVLFWMGVKPSTLARFYTATRDARVRSGEG
jgi:rSAM/selenodomain-associated transferase 2